MRQGLLVIASLATVAVVCGCGMYSRPWWYVSFIRPYSNGAEFACTTQRYYKCYYNCYFADSFTGNDATDWLRSGKDTECRQDEKGCAAECGWAPILSYLEPFSMYPDGVCHFGCWNVTSNVFWTMLLLIISAAGVPVFMTLFSLLR